MKLADNIVKFGWGGLFIWILGGFALGHLYPNVLFYLPRGIIAIFSLILFMFATVLWAIAKIWKAGTGGPTEKR